MSLTARAKLLAMTSQVAIPTDEEHLSSLAHPQSHLLKRAYAQVDPADTPTKALSVALSCLYQAATCHRQCHGGPHVLEALFGRAYNLGVSSWTLICVCQYDEALNLIRGLSEINNLVLLLTIDQSLISKWLNATKKERLNGFGPAAVRKALLAKGMSADFVGVDWYAEFCEKYVHPTPTTRPNQHTDGLPGQIGPVPQADGEQLALSELFEAAVRAALAASKWFDMPDIAEKLQRMIEDEAK
ncbi:hypothetical protein ACSFA2_22545 [Variovorax sp. LT2P21]|uniref:hypothetical protein n=1 Tax=Variovorax sp. LT2P21 TaxID=3443731 RepID=UPI003F453856